MTNETLMQYFEWYLPTDGKHWQRLVNDIDTLKELGVNKVWMPPAFKGTGVEDVGYGVYDLFDLGEFDQKGTVPTKYGTKEDYLRATEALNKAGIMPIADVVLNHKANGDDKERFKVLKMSQTNRQEPLSEPYDIEAWTHFTFPGRQKQYDEFEWHWYHFSGMDYDALHNETGLYMVMGDNKGWADQDSVDEENGNYDYLMFNDVDFRHPEVVANLKKWVEWFLKTSQVGGFRLDAVKHIDSDFMAEFIRYIRDHLKEDLYVFGEYWKDDTEENIDYLDAVDLQFDLVDVVLHMNFYQASKDGQEFDLSQILEGSLMQTRPDFAVTFVDNHDSQRGQSLESTVADWFKPLAYSLIMLRQEGKPCLFYGDYYGIEGEFAQASFKDIIDKLAYLRQNHVYGNQVDYFDHPNCIGWVNQGDEAHPEPLAVVMSNSDAGWKDMEIGQWHAGRIFRDYLGHSQEEVVVDDAGWGSFPVQAGSVSAWIPRD
ncbi:alpha-amylase [Streptococcus pluranimalium]|uniref:alpha-amylase n=1 Tax=Streptococcus pluranimalium TaxID=82348 RepID=UPI0039FD9FFB